MAYQQQGIGLTELLISMAMAATLSLALVTVHLQGSRQYQQQIAWQDASENGQFALQLLQHELRMAGFYRPVQAALPAAFCEEVFHWMMDIKPGLDVLHSGQLQSARGIAGHHACLNIAPLENTDVLWVRRLAAQPVQEDQLLPKDWYLLQTYHGKQLTDSRFVYLNGWADVSSAADVQYLAWPLRSRLFYIRSYSVKGDNVPSLVMVSPMKDSFQHQVLVEGIDALQLEWGVTEQQKLRFIREPLAGQLDSAITVRIYLRSRPRRLLPGEAVIYRHFNNHVMLRNRQSAL